MRCEWRECDLSEIVELIIDYRGKTPKKLGSDWSTTGIRALSAKNVKTGKIVQEDTIRFVDNELYKKWMKDEVRRGDILITSEAPFGEVYCWNSDEKIVLSQRLFGVRIDGSCSHQFLYYYMTTPQFQGELRGRATGTTVVGLRQPELLKCKVCLPTLPEQKAIAAVLSALDDKIELNNRINQKLEEIAQAIFKSWFVDFEPFQDGEFVESELGLIPKGWRVERLSELCHSVSKKHDFNSKELIFLNTGDIENGKFLHSNYMSVDIMPGQAKKSIQYGDILYSEIRPINRHFAFVNFEAGEYVVSTKLMVIRANSVNKRRLYNYLTSDSVIAELQMEAESRSGTFPQIRFENLQNLKMLIASHEVEVQYSELLERVYGLLDEHTAENLRLSTIRDTLLPKLMSGEIRVPFEQ